MRRLTLFLCSWRRRLGLGSRLCLWLTPAAFGTLALLCSRLLCLSLVVVITSVTTVGILGGCLALTAASLLAWSSKATFTESLLVELLESTRDVCLERRDLRLWAGLSAGGLPVNL